MSEFSSPMSTPHSVDPKMRQAKAGPTGAELQALRFAADSARSDDGALLDSLYRKLRIGNPLASPLPSAPSPDQIPPAIAIGMKVIVKRGDLAGREVLITGGPFTHYHGRDDGYFVRVDAYDLALPSAPSPEEARMRQAGYELAQIAHGAKLSDHVRGRLHEIGAALGFPCDCGLSVAQSSDSRVVSPSAGARMSEQEASDLISEFETTVLGIASKYRSHTPVEDARRVGMRIVARDKLLKALVGPSQPSTDTESR